MSQLFFLFFFSFPFIYRTRDEMSQLALRAGAIVTAAIRHILIILFESRPYRYSILEIY